MTTNLVSPSGAISDDALASQMDGRIAFNEKKLALKEKKMMMELYQRKEDKEREYKMQENMMQFMTAVMNRLPDTGSGNNRDATVAPTAFTQFSILDPVHHIPSVNRFLRISRTNFVSKHHDERARSTTATRQHTKRCSSRH